MFEKINQQIKLNKQFEVAFFKRDLHEIKNLFSEEKTEIPDLNKEIQSLAPIMIAAQNKDWELVEILYDLGANLDVCIMPLKWNLLDECIVNAPKRIVKAMIEYCDVNAQTEKGETPLMIAIKRNKLEMIELLLKAEKLNITIVDRNGENVAHYAIRENNNDLFLRLVGNEAVLLRKNRKGITPLDLIDDPVFKASIPLKMEKMNKTEEKINSKEIKESVEYSKPEILQEKQRKVTGLSVIKKKTF